MLSVPGSGVVLPVTGPAQPLRPMLVSDAARRSAIFEILSASFFLEPIMLDIISISLSGDALWSQAQARSSPMRSKASGLEGVDVTGQKAKKRAGDRRG